MNKLFEMIGHVAMICFVLFVTVGVWLMGFAQVLRAVGLIS